MYFLLKKKRKMVKICIQSRWIVLLIDSTDAGGVTNIKDLLKWPLCGFNEDFEIYNLCMNYSILLKLLQFKWICRVLII